MMQPNEARARRGGLGVAVGLAASMTAACSGTPSPPPSRHAGPPVALTSQLVAGEGVAIANTNGALHVVGDPNATTVTATMMPFAFANSKSDADEAIADVVGTFTITPHPQPAFVRIDCGQADGDHGSAQRTQTGCDLTVTVPAGSASAPMIVGADVLTGDVVAEGITGPSANVFGSWQVGDGNLTLNIAGSVSATVTSGSVDATVTPSSGSFILIEDDGGDVVLKVPADFACDSLQLGSTDGTTIIDPGFTNGVTAKSRSVGVEGAGAASMSVSAQGDLTLVPRQ